MQILTCYSPVRRSSAPEGLLPLDLHVLSLPPAFNLSHDQTLQIVPNQDDKVYETISKEQSLLETQFGKFQIEWIDHMEGLQLDTNPSVAYLDADQLSWPLLNRTWVNTDYFYPLGMRKKKEIEPFFRESKIKPALKSKNNCALRKS